MTEDQLSHDERRRLECVAQAVALRAGGVNPSDGGTVVRTAAVIERYVRSGTVPR
jgi:hypothetical protein